MAPLLSNARGEDVLPEQGGDHNHRTRGVCHVTATEEAGGSSYEWLVTLLGASRGSVPTANL